MRSALSFTLPSVVAAIAGALVVGFADGLINVSGALEIAASAGFFGLLAFPIALALALAARGLWRAWRFDELVEAWTEPTGGAPQLVGWGAYAFLAVWFLSGVTFNVLRLLMFRTSSRAVVALAAALILAFVGGVLVAVSRPAARGIAALVRALDRRLAQRLETSLFTPRRAALAGAAAVTALLYGAWLVSVRPRIGHLDVGFVRYLVAGAVVVIAVHAGWPWLSRRRAAALGAAVGCAAVAAAALGAASYARYARPYAMLDIWGNTRVTGDVIDAIWDIQALRGELRLGEFAPEPKPGAKHPNILLITVDTVRADRTPIHGGKASMPTLAALARDGTVFDRAFSPGNVTRRSLPTFALGLSPRRVRGRVAGWALRLDPRHVTLAERLRAAGYDTAGFFCCESQFGPRHRLGLIRGFDELFIEYEGGKLAEAAADFMRGRENARPLFMWIHLIEPHLWEKTYKKHKHGKDRKHRYDKSLIKTDTFLRTLMQVVRTAKRKDDTIVLLTADHGEALGDHGYRNHSTALYNSQIHVPFVVAGPGIAKQRVQQPVGLVDLVPTIIDLAGYVPPGMPSMDGKSLAPLLRGEIESKLEQGEALAEMVEDRSVKRDVFALIRGRHKLIYRDDAKKPELYDIVADPGEKKNLAKTQRATLEQMIERLDAIRTQHEIPPF